MNPVRASLRHPQVTLAITAMAAAAGIYALATMPRREDPKMTIRQGLIAAVYPGATAEQVEEQVTRKIEDRLFRFDEVRKQKTYSTSRPGVVYIVVQLEDRVRNTDVFWSKLRHDLNELRVRELPQGVRGPVVNSDFGDTVAMLIAVSGEHYGPRELKTYVERIESGLRTLRPVSKLKRYGERKEAIYVTSGLERLAQYGVNPVRVIQALQGRNVIEFAGRFPAPQASVEMRASGLFQTEDQIRRVMVDVSPLTGQPVYLGDIAAVARRYQDPPDFLTRIDGRPCLMLSVEMQEGFNIVQFGDAIRQKLAEMKPLLPPDLETTLVADQPRVVSTRIGDFMREFAIAIVAVILVTMLLLPFRVAAIAAIAIPITVAITFGILNALGIELHQVSIAALIVVLGMVVDDAIIIADNYVELLDRRVPREEASGRAATELAVPVLTATLTIIASFAPLLLLTGSVGEFISALPIAVAVSLAASYVVAMLVTPLLCRAFIKTGLHQPGAAPHKSRFRPLDAMQALYDRSIQVAMRHRGLTVAAGVAIFVLGLAMLGFVPSRFFPFAERNQFIVDVWMPEGARIEATDTVVRRIEGELKRLPEVAASASFVGSSAPRFYYNVNPQEPASNYAQVLVNTRSAEATPELVRHLRRLLTRACPEALVMVRELQQGTVMEAPVEVRITGPELAPLKDLGARAAAILKETPGSAYVHSDFHEDTWDLKIDIDNEVANRVGLTNASVARQLAGSFEGAPVSTFWEGDRAVDIVLRLDESRRHSFDNVRDAYMTSLLTGARVPVREFARLSPEWLTGRIVRRNGSRTLTVRSHFASGQLASNILKAARPRIAALPLPPGYRIDYGGERESQQETFGEMSQALVASLLLIFLVLLFEFRSLKQSLLVMVSIALALFGAVLGLVLTRNPFGFTAYVGIVSLSGIVVRNAIILVDYINERRGHGEALEQAALDAGKRRLRPIFLTTMAAAVGVTPMIVSGSSLWSPLASTIAVGLVCSMATTLVVVPVLYVLIEKDTRPQEAAQ